MRRTRSRSTVLALVAGLITLSSLIACETQPPLPQTGTISGALSVVASGAAEGPHTVVAHAARGASLPSVRPASTSVVGDIVPGEIIVRFVHGARTSALATLDVGAVQLRLERPLALPSTALYRAPADRAATLALVAALRTRADVLYAEPNLILHPLRTPNDPAYGLQWHYPAIGLPAAWDVTTGSAAIVVAVGDTGILFAGDASPATHPDLVGRVLPGYDFISDPSVAGDGDGRDPDPYDVGDNPGGQASYHGSHVAGTIGASTGNALGVAGVDWAAKLLPVRMLGGGGGSLVDIIEGTLWAAGFSVSGVPTNPSPAHVINLSLGGTSPCSAFAQDAFDRIAAEAPNAAIVVVAAGNEDADAGFSIPANCGNVITVGATDYVGERAPYSNYGARIDVMAPGGDTGANFSGNGNDGVLSVSRDDSTGAFNYVFENGTSMAAPHVAGVVSLMKSLEPTLSLTQTLAVLTSTARPLTAGECVRPSSADCGAGLIDAAAAVAAVAGDDIPTPGGGSIAYDPNPVDYGSTLATRDIRLTNTGATAVAWELKEYDPNPSNPGDILDGGVFFAAGAPSSGALAAGASVTTTIGIDRTRVTAPGPYAIDLLFLVDGVQQPLTLRFRTEAAPLSPSGPLKIFALQDGPAGDLVVAGSQTYASFVTSYVFTTAVGSNVVLAWSDENGTDLIDDGDFLGFFASPVSVAAGQAVTGIDIALAPVLSAGGALHPALDGLDSLATLNALLKGAAVE